MANAWEPTDDERMNWAAWVAGRPDNVRAVAERLSPWKLYLLKSSGHRVTIVSFGEPMDPTNPVTLTVAVTGKYNFVAFERQVFGIAPDDLEECDLPPAGEVLGAAVMDPDPHALRHVWSRMLDAGKSPADYTHEEFLRMYNESLARVTDVLGPREPRRESKWTAN